jgi:glycosyltransferase involved in cell wall biosynthesis
MQPAGIASHSELKLYSTKRPRRSYLLAVQQIPFYRDPSGSLFVGKLWHKDLGMHLDYLEHLMIAAPVLQQPPPEDAVPLNDDPRMARLEIVELPYHQSRIGALKVMPKMVARLWRAVGRADTVHTAVAGWPFPMGWIVTPMALLKHKPFMIVVESAPWRIQKGLPSSPKSRTNATVYEAMSRWILRCADLCIFTHEGYRQSMMGKDSTRAHVIPASWIDERDILSQHDAEALWRNKTTNSSRLHILFTGRLLPEKGLLVLFDAIRQISAHAEPIRLDVLGEGPLQQAAEDLSKQLGDGPTQVRMLGTVQYGGPLFELLRTYHAVIVPSISDEQPRIVFDAYSQAVPVLASDTEGLRSCVREGETGLLVPPSDAKALADLLQRLRSERNELARMGLNSLTCARSMTHQHMHRQRAALLGLLNMI